MSLTADLTLTLPTHTRTIPGQVEHPVTEMVGGEDLVEHMLWVAGGQPLPDRMIKQPFIPANGHAFESRVYAEDPIRKFLPSIGPLINYKEPETNFACGASFDEAHAAAAAAPDGCVTRVDSGVYEGGEISMYYDPMISKLITHGPDRPTALRAMARSLDEYIISGLGNNLSFLRSVCRNEKFAVGDYGTGFIAEEYPEGFSGVVLHESELRRMAAMGATLHWAKAGGQEQEDAQSAFVVTMPKGGESKKERCFAVSVSMSGALDDAEDEDLDADMDTFNEGGVVVRMWDLDQISQLPSEGDAAAHYASHEIVIRDLDWRTGAPDMRVVLEDGTDVPKGEAAKVEAQQGEEEAVTYEGRTSAGIMLRYRGARREIVVRTPREHELSGHMLEPEEKDLSAFLVSPMPGTLVSCDVQAGDFVEEGQQLAVVEAMKMQNSLRAEMSGQVAAVRVSAGDQLKVDQIIIEFVVPEAADEAKEAA